MAEHHRNFKKRSIYIDDETYNELKNRSSEYGLPISKFARELIKNGEVKRDDPIRQDLKIELRKIGTNLNQIARKFNQNEFPALELQEELEQFSTKVNELDDKLSQK